MQWVEDDAEVNPIVSKSRLEYVRCLPDSYRQYTRFFDALLISRQSHSAFFRDLRAFRELPTTIQALTLCNPASPSISKQQRTENYRSVTSQFLNSRFAHPWCRKAAAGTRDSKPGGWWGAEWTATGRRMSKEGQAEEDKLHKLLVPLWVCFRSKMFPSDEVVEAWWEERQLHPPPDKPVDLLDSSGANSEPTSGDDDDNDDDDDNVISRSKKTSHRTDRPPASRPENAAIEDDDDDDEVQLRDRTTASQQAGSVATGLLRLAAAGMIINSMPKMQKWKLKRELKKQRT